MRSIVLILLCSSLCFSQNTFVPDDNFEQALIDLGLDSGPLDDFVPTAMINTVTYLNISEKNISELTGIEDFAALDHLDVYINDLQTLDVSNNQQLRLLRCYQNDLTNLTLGSNTALEQVWTYDNYLTTIDVSGLPNLDRLSILNNDLVSLDVTNNLQLRLLWCYDNEIPVLDVSNNTQLELLWCSGNTIESLDLSNSVNLNTILCHQNNITTLDLSNNSLLTYLSCYTNELTYLNVKNGNNTNVTNFQANGNPDLDCIEVDDANYSEVNWIYVDSNANFNGDCNNLSLDDFLVGQIQIFPNPTSDTITIQNLNGQSFYFELYDVSGKKLMKTKLNTIDVSNLNSGLYFLKMVSNSVILTKKVIKI
ncbi:T9SS type A sorting domain-containing protein [Psychroserpens ponticola]|uniref:T9SS type A sorting domain-containing protein n=1 Tax=Psychroserpens ponticola TaxID=2932268 RepID=A0ABY7S240_9FLAO|nr:T9SS type A sorting domain-containing protein [Psychroserpens ponticola]WCO03461.1 T9SS type A sorting domain-containing protein [Psychroserpens ponticola]